VSRPTPTRGKRARAAEAAAASHALAPDAVSTRRRRVQLEATIATGSANADAMQEAGKVRAAAKCRSNLERYIAELAAL
jgi:hypothetical protein